MTFAAEVELGTGGRRVVPSRWRDPQPDGFSARAFWRLLGVKVPTSDPRFGTLRQTLREGDPLADAVVDWMHASGVSESRALFDRALDRGIDSLADPPRPLAALFASLDRVPAWVDRAQLREGTETMLRIGPAGFYALGAFSLMSGYRSAAAVKPLAMTGALTKMARRRLAETSRFVLDIAASEGLPRHSEAFKSIARVRVLHALIRHGLARSPRWNSDAWGTPINQHDMLATSLEFSAMQIVGIAPLGVVLTRRERESLMHLWRYAGYLSGVREDLLPATLREGLELMWMYYKTEAGPDDDSRALTAALLNVSREGRAGRIDRLAGELDARFFAGLSRFMLGRALADDLGIPDTPWKYAPLLVAPLFAAIDSIQVRTPGGRKRAVRARHALLRTRIGAMLGPQKPAYQPYGVTTAAGAAERSTGNGAARDARGGRAK